MSFFSYVEKRKEVGRRYERGGPAKVCATRERAKTTEIEVLAKNADPFRRGNGGEWREVVGGEGGGSEGERGWEIKSRKSGRVWGVGGGGEREEREWGMKR